MELKLTQVSKRPPQERGALLGREWGNEDIPIHTVEKEYGIGCEYQLVVFTILLKPFLIYFHTYHIPS